MLCCGHPFFLSLSRSPRRRHNVQLLVLPVRRSSLCELWSTDFQSQCRAKKDSSETFFSCGCSLSFSLPRIRLNLQNFVEKTFDAVSVHGLQAEYLG